MSRRIPDWIVAVAAGVSTDEPLPHFRCERCHERMVTKLPMRIETFCEVARGFGRAHRRCLNAAAAAVGQ